MKAFFSDLDNTLIYSHRTPIEDSKVLVERLNGKEQSYMTAFAFSFLQSADWLSIIPVTTRSQEQYQRLVFPESFRIKYALICNGGKLLIDGIEDYEWSVSTLNMVHDDLPDLEWLSIKLKDLCRSDVHCPESYYHYVKTESPEKICTILKSEYQKDNIIIEHDHSKVYLFPRSVNKGEAVRRFLNRFETLISIGAGDSSIDVPLLNVVNYPLAAISICSNIQNPDVKPLTGRIISDQICRELEHLHKNDIN